MGNNCMPYLSKNITFLYLFYGGKASMARV